MEATMSLEHDPARQDHRSTRQARQPRGPPRQSYATQTIMQFCADNQISRAQYYVLKAKGLGPDETRFGENSQIVLITAKSAEKWRRKHTKSARARARKQSNIT